MIFRIGLDGLAVIGKRPADIAAVAVDIGPVVECDLIFRIELDGFVKVDQCPVDIALVAVFKTAVVVIDRGLRAFQDRVVASGDRRVPAQRLAAVRVICLPVAIGFVPVATSVKLPLELTM